MTDDIDTLVGKNLARLRAARGLSQAQLSAELNDAGLGFFPQTIGKIEQGARKLTLVEAGTVASVLEVSVGALLNEGDIPDEVTRLSMYLRDAAKAAAGIRESSKAYREAQGLLNGVMVIIEMTNEDIQGVPHQDVERARQVLATTAEAIAVEDES